MKCGAFDFVTIGQHLPPPQASPGDFLERGRIGEHGNELET